MCAKVVVEPIANRIEHALRGVYLYGTAPGERSEVIKPSDVVIMLMCQQNGIDAVDAGSNGLRPKVRTTIDKYPLIFVGSKERRGARTLIVRIPA